MPLNQITKSALQKDRQHLIKAIHAFNTAPTNTDTSNKHRNIPFQNQQAQLLAVHTFPFYFETPHAWTR